MSDLPDKQRFKTGSTGRTLDLDVRDENGTLIDLNSYPGTKVYWVPKLTDPDSAVQFTNVTLVASPTAAPNVLIRFSTAEISDANMGRHYVWVEVTTGIGIVQPPEDSRGIEIEIYE